MDQARRQRIEDVCTAALDYTGDDRTAFVAAACGDDEGLRQEVEALLVHASSGETFLGGPIGFAAAQVLSEERGGSLVGQQIGSYTVLSLLGAGGMGEVYRARDPRLARDVAIKVLPADPTLDRSRSRRFRREAQAIAGLNHPHICVVHDVGEQDGISYLVMEYLEGETLKARLGHQAPLPLPEALTIAFEIASALVEAHRHGIVHRDVKPANIMLTARGTKLLDFGLARRRVEAMESTSKAALTSAGMVLGTPHYMSPEQARGQPVDARSDVFSLGAVIYEMVTGCRPFDGVNVIDTIDAVLHKDPRAVSDLRPEAPAALGPLIAKCLAKDSAERYQSVEPLWTDLLDVRQGTAPRTWMPPPIRRHNLPLQVTSFVGRESEIAELCSALTETRLLTLSGSGGCGKTRLALRVASNMVDNYPDGVWLTELAAVTDGELIVHSVASALGIDEVPGRRLQQRLADYLEAKRLLLVLDNCEHLVAAAAPFVQSILTSCEGIQILTTSREPLRVPGERIWRVPPLSVPESVSLPLPEVSDYEGVRLFVERARAVSPLILDHASASHVVEICRRLDGIPLALEMAAARLDVLSLDQIASRLNDRFGLLTRTHRTSARRQETLRSTIDWSYDLLSSSEQTLFRRLAAFAGTFSLEAAEAVCSGSDVRPKDVLEILSGLVEKSLVTVSRTNLGVRYRLLETVLAYARETFVGTSDERGTSNKHLEFFLTFAERLEPEFYSGVAARYHDQVEQEHQNILAALEWCNKGRGRSRKALRLASALMPFWSVRCYHQLGKQLLLRALNQDRRCAPKPVLIKALDAAGYFLRITGEVEAARLAHEEGLRLANEAGEQPGVAKALWQLGIAASMQGREVEAEALQRQSLAVSRTHGSSVTMASALDNLGIHAFHRGEYALAQSYWQESHDIFRDLGFEIGLTMSLLHHAALASQTDAQRARSLATEALAKARATRHKGNVAFALLVLGNLYARNSEYHRSRALYEEALAIVRDVGYKRQIAMALVSLGDISIIEGRYAEADRLLNESYTLLTQLHEEESPDASGCLQSLGWLAVEQGYFERAREVCQRALSFEGFKTERPNLLRLLGWICLAQGDGVGARSAFAESLTLAHELGMIGGVAGAQLGIGYVELLDDRVREAQLLFQMALSVFTRFDNHVRIIDAVLGLGDAALHAAQLEQARGRYLRALRLARDMGRLRDVARTLRSVGVIASRQQQPDLAARCFGASSALLEAVGCRLSPFESVGYEAAVDAVRSEIGFDRFRRLWDESSMVPIDRIGGFIDEHIIDKGQ